MKTMSRLTAKVLHRLVPDSFGPVARALRREIFDAPEAADGFQFGRRFRPAAAPANGKAGPHPPPSGAPANALEAYFDAHREGPGIWKWRHYFEAYHRHLAKFVGREVHVLEVGIYSGGSLPMWREYFGPGCTVYGVDVREECREYEKSGFRVFIGDQSDRGFWERFRREVPALDVVIDDGGHWPHQQVATIEELLPHLRPGGVYACEDIHYPFNSFHAYLTGLTSNLNDFAPREVEDGAASAPSAFQASVWSVCFYPYLAVIERSQGPRHDFHAPRHGTQWQPFL